MNKNIIIALVAIVVAIGGAYFILSGNNKDTNTVAPKENTQVQDESKPHSHDQ